MGGVVDCELKRAPCVSFDTSSRYFCLILSNRSDESGFPSTTNHLRQELLGHITFSLLILSQFKVSHIGIALGLILKKDYLNSK